MRGGAEIDSACLFDLFAARRYRVLDHQILAAASADMRFPANKRRASEVYAAWQRSLAHHLSDRHGLTVTRDRWGIYSYAGGIVNLSRLHEQQHEEA